MSFSNLPNELLLDITAFLTDPCDYHVFQQLNKRTYLLLQPRFFSIFNYPMFLARASTEDIEGPETTQAGRAARKTLLALGDLLMKASEYGWERLFRAAVRKGAPLYRQREVYCREDSIQWIEPLIGAVVGGNIRVVEFFVKETSADVNSYSPWNRSFFSESVSALHVATLTRNAEIIKLLLDNHAWVDILDDEGQTPLNYATRIHPLQSNIIEILLEAGANPDIGGPEVASPLFEIAPWDHKLVEMLIRYGAKASRDFLMDVFFLPASSLHGLPRSSALHHCVYIPVAGEETVPFANVRSMGVLLEGCSINIDHQSADGSTTLHVAAEYGLKEAVLFLLGRGANKEIEDYDGRTAYEKAQIKGHSAVAELLRGFKLSCMCRNFCS